MNHQITSTKYLSILYYNLMLKTNKKPQRNTPPQTTKTQNQTKKKTKKNQPKETLEQKPNNQKKLSKT